MNIKEKKASVVIYQDTFGRIVKASGGRFFVEKKGTDSLGDPSWTNAFMLDSITTSLLIHLLK